MANEAQLDSLLAGLERVVSAMEAANKAKEKADTSRERIKSTTGGREARQQAAGRAADDLEAFVIQFAGESDNASQVRDSLRRLRRLGVKIPGGVHPAASSRAGVVPSLVFGSGAGVLAALSIARGLQVQAIEDDLETNMHFRNVFLGDNEDSIENLQRRGEDYARDVNILLASSISCAVASLVSLAIWRGQSRAHQASLNPPTITLAWAPGSKGALAVGLEGNW